MTQIPVSPEQRFVIEPATLEIWDEGHPTHKILDDVLSKVGDHVRLQMIENSGPYCEICIVRSTGKGAYIPASPLQPKVPADKRQFLRDLCVRANQEVAYCGFWVFCWTNAFDPRAITGMWFDYAGDEHIAWDDERPWDALGRPGESFQTFGMENYLKNLDKSIQIWVERQRNIELTEKQLLMSALGQRHPN